MSQSQVGVLVVFANPRDTNSLRLGTEDRAIRQSIERSRYRDNITLTTCRATTIHDLRRALLEGNYQIVHISGHGTNTGLVLEDELGGQSVVPQQALADLLRAYSPPLKCVVLNACFSISQGQLASLGVPFTVAMEGSISDEAAIEFSRGFYDAIGAGWDIEFAYEEGCRTVQLAAPNARFVPTILKDMTKSLALTDSASAGKGDLTSTVSSLPLIFVLKRESPAPMVRDFEVALSEGEIIVGQCWECVLQGMLHTGGTAFLIRGPGKFKFAVKDGWWAQYQNANWSDGERLLQEQIDSIIVHGNSPSPKAVRVPRDGGYAPRF